MGGCDTDTLTQLLMTKQQTYAQLEEAAKHYASVTDQEAHGFDFIREVFIAGAKWQKEQNMEEAVEGDIWVDHGFASVPASLQINLGYIKGNEEVHEGDKVRVIIVKE